MRRNTLASSSALSSHSECSSPTLDQMCPMKTSRLKLANFIGNIFDNDNNINNEIGDIERFIGLFIFLDLFINHHHRSCLAHVEP